MRRILLSAMVGVVVLALLGGWAVLSHSGAPETRGWVTSCAVVAGGLLAGAVLGRSDPLFPGLLALTVAVGAVLTTLPGSVSGLPTAPPLGYMNANGALLLGGAAGAVVAAGPHERRWQHAASLVALLLAGVCVVDGAQAAALACLAVAVWGWARGHGSRAEWAVLGVVTVAIPALLPVAWAAGALPRPAALVSALSEERFALWTEAWGLLVGDPVSGVGPGRFSQQAPTAADPDLAWAHSAVLQAGAELGWVGVGLLGLFVAWALVALGRDGVLLGILLLPASVDYVLHFGGVLLVSSLVVGGALASSGAAAPGTGKPWLTPPSP